MGLLGRLRGRGGPGGGGHGPLAGEPEGSWFAAQSRFRAARWYQLEGDVGAGLAPGRLDLLGGVADFSGAQVLQCPTAKLKTLVSVAPRRVVGPEAWAELGGGEGEGDDADGGVVLLIESKSDPAMGGLGALRCCVPLDKLKGLPLHRAGAALRDEAASGCPPWAVYAVGSVLAFCMKARWFPEESLFVEVLSTLPLGQGVSSSAALEVATMKALAALTGIGLANPAKGLTEDRNIATLGQMVENFVVGAPCGIMDQIACSCANYQPEVRPPLVPVCCRPGELGPLTKLPKDVCVLGWPSGVRHDLVGPSKYMVARAATFMGKKIAEGLLAAMVADAGWLQAFKQRMGEGGVEPGQVDYVLQSVQALKFPVKYLTEISRNLLDEIEDRLPATLSGADFLAAHGGVDDPLSQIEAGTEYPVRAAVRFAIHAHTHGNAALTMLNMLAQGKIGSDRVLERVGEFMGLQHRLYSDMGLGSPETDEIVDLALGLREKGVWGARVGGGGCGGTVVVLCHRRAKKGLARLMEQYFERKGLPDPRQSPAAGPSGVQIFIE